MSKYTSGTIPQAQKVCRFCIHTYEIYYIKDITAPCRGVEIPTELCCKGLNNT